ncbi:MAG: amidinotransferase [Candidatus Saganbacteria bacterium]|nr:amidinotransferase [Candidatus Saganbacteria bacterium]
MKIKSKKFWGLTSCIAVIFSLFILVNVFAVTIENTTLIAKAQRAITVETKPSQLTDTVFMVSPDDFAYNPETAKSNLFQHQLKDTSKVTSLAVEQFDNMVKILEAKGINVIHVPSRKDIKTPDAVFPNNWFSTHKTKDGKNILVIYPMLTPNRRAEVRIDLLKTNLKENGYAISKVIDLSYFDKQNKFLEGTGSMVLDRVNHVTFASLSPRTDKVVLNEFCKQLNYSPIMFHTYDQNGKLIYHTNVIMSIGEDFAVIAANNIKNIKERKLVLNELRRLGKTIIKISPDQVNNMCGNILELKTKDNNNIIVMSTTAYNNFTPEQKAELEKSGKIVAVDIHTIEKVGGGSARCMLSEVF